MPAAANYHLGQIVLAAAGRAFLAALIALAFAGGWSAARAAELPATIHQALQEAGIPARSVAIVVQAVDGRPALLAHDARQVMNPASAMKLVTTYAGLKLSDLPIPGAPKRSLQPAPGQQQSSRERFIYAAAAIPNSLSNTSGCCCANSARAG